MLTGAVLAATWVALVAATASDGNGGPDVVGYVLNYGVLGVITALWLAGRIKTGADVLAAVARAEAAEARERELNNVIRADVVPALTRVTELGARLLDANHRPQ